MPICVLGMDGGGGVLGGEGCLRFEKSGKNQKILFIVCSFPEIYSSFVQF
jgi:hypothetical protein